MVKTILLFQFAEEFEVRRDELLIFRIESTDV